MKIIDALLGMAVSGLNDIARTLDGTYERQYWSGYQDGFRDAEEVFKDSA